MKKNIKVSVIVPICNSEKNIKQCIGSISSQTLQDIEIIFVDDGTTDSSATICKEFAETDKRIRVIHQEQKGLGEALNAGISLARGEYIGFVDPNDWLDANMYEELYEKAKTHQVDVVKSLYNEEREKGKTQIANKYAQCKYVHQRVEDSLLVPELMQDRISPWAAIYRNSFIKQNHITFPASSDEVILDEAFFSQVFIRLESLYILSQSFYHHRCHYPRNSHSSGYKAAKISLLTQNWIKNWIIENKIPPAYREFFAAIALRKTIRHAKDNCKGLQKIKLLKRAAKLFKDYLPRITYKYFTPLERKQFTRIVKHPVFYALKMIGYDRVQNDESKHVKILGVKIHEIRTKPGNTARKILGISYHRKIQTPDHVEWCFMGIPYRTHKIKPIVRQDAIMLDMAATANAIAGTHSKVFPKYKNSLRNQEAMIVATGPTTLYAPLMQGAKHLAVNRAITLDKYHFDYYFVIDNRAFSSITDTIINYDCVKFFGKYAHSQLERLSIPDWVAEAAHAERFYSTVPHTIHAHHDIEYFPLTDFGTIVHMAMHFLLYTHPRRIYLVGCDTNASGYYDKSLPASPLNVVAIKRGYLKLRDLRDRFYPDVEIVSINPVGLRGMFKDVYTKSYLAEHPEINVSAEQILEEESSALPAPPHK